MTHLMVGRCLILTLVIFGLLLNFIYLLIFLCFFLSIFNWFCWLSAFVFWLFLRYVPWLYYFVRAKEERRLFPRIIRFMCFFSVFVWPLKTRFWSFSFFMVVIYQYFWWFSLLPKQKITKFAHKSLAYWIKSPSQPEKSLKSSDFFCHRAATLFKTFFLL